MISAKAGSRKSDKIRNARIILNKLKHDTGSIASAFMDPKC